MITLIQKYFRLIYQAIGLIIVASFFVVTSVEAAASPSIEINKAVVNGDDLTLTYTVTLLPIPGDTNKYGVAFAVIADNRVVKTNAIPITPAPGPQIKSITIALATVPTDESPKKVVINAATIVKNFSKGQVEQIIASQTDINVAIEPTKELFDPDLGYNAVRAELPTLRQNFVRVMLNFLDQVFWPMFILFAIVFSGIMYIMARDDEEKVKRARNYLIATVSVIIILILGYFVSDQFSLLIRYLIAGGG